MGISRGMTQLQMIIFGKQMSRMRLEINCVAHYIRAVLGERVTGTRGAVNVVQYEPNLTWRKV